MSLQRLIRQEVPLIDAEAKLNVIAFPRGYRGEVIVEVFPAAYTGDVPGVTYYTQAWWKSALTFAAALKTEVRDKILRGEGVVEGKNYAPVMWDFVPMNQEQGTSRCRIFMTAEDCLNVGEALVEAAEYAQRKPGLV